MAEAPPRRPRFRRTVDEPLPDPTPCPRCREPLGLHTYLMLIECSEALGYLQGADGGDGGR